MNISNLPSLIISLAALALVFTACSQRRNNNVTIVNYAGEGLDLKAVTDCAVKSKTAEEFEKKLNTSGNKLNNLDLDEDDKIDYIKVTEISEGKMKGFSLTVEMPDKQEQEICTIQIEKEDEKHARVQTRGNHHIYGHNHYYYHRPSIGNVLIWHYMMSDHRPYRSRYGYNNYPSHFSSSSRPMSQAQYSGFHSSQPYNNSYQKTSASKTSTPLRSPNANKTASNIKAPLRNPSTSQKSFQKSNPSRSFRSSSSGSSYGSSSSSRFGSSSSSRSGSSFGGGK